MSAKDIRLENLVLGQIIGCSGPVFLGTEKVGRWVVNPDGLTVKIKTQFEYTREGGDDWRNRTIRLDEYVEVTDEETLARLWEDWAKYNKIDSPESWEEWCNRYFPGWQPSQSDQ